MDAGLPCVAVMPAPAVDRAPRKRPRGLADGGVGRRGARACLPDMPMPRCCADLSSASTQPYCSSFFQPPGGVAVDGDPLVVDAGIDMGHDPQPRFRRHGVHRAALRRFHEADNAATVRKPGMQPSRISDSSTRPPKRRQAMAPFEDLIVRSPKRTPDARRGLHGFFPATRAVLNDLPAPSRRGASKPGCSRDTVCAAKAGAPR